MNANVRIEIGLKTEINRQVGKKNYAIVVANYNQVCMVNAWKRLYACGLRDELAEMIWETILDCKGEVWYSCMSAEMGLLSVIKDYTDKKGVVKPAHFSIYDNYVGSIEKLGPVPTSYQGNFKITRSGFNLNLDRLPALTPFDDVMDLSRLFSIKNSLVVKSPPVVAKPLPIVAKKKTAVTKPAPKKKPAVPKFAPTLSTLADDSDDEDVPIGLLIRRKAVRT